MSLELDVINVSWYCITTSVLPLKLPIANTNEQSNDITHDLQPTTPTCQIALPCVLCVLVPAHNVYLQCVVFLIDHFGQVCMNTSKGVGVCDVFVGVLHCSYMCSQVNYGSTQAGILYVWGMRSTYVRTYVHKYVHCTLCTVSPKLLSLVSFQRIESSLLQPSSSLTFLPSFFTVLAQPYDECI